MTKYFAFTLFIITLVISSCVQETRSETELVIQKTCNEKTCNFELVEDDVLVQTKFMGNQVRHVERTKSLGEQNDAGLTWVLPTGSSFATSQQMIGAILPSCGGDGNCNSATNPTGMVFETADTFDMRVSGAITLSDGSVVNVDKSIDVVLTGFPTRLTYQMPSGSTITAVAAGQAFANFANKESLAEVIGQGGTDGTLTFVCQEVTYMDPAVDSLSEGAFQNFLEWTKVDSVKPTPTFNGTSWENISFVTAANNVELDLPSGKDWGTALDCGKPK